MINFRVDGPFEIPLMRGTRVIDTHARSRFWETHGDLVSEIGCYVFGIRAGSGITPVYVGQAKCGFGQECLADGKLLHYNTELAKRRGTPVLFLVAKEGGAGGALETCINHVEHFLIQFALERNPELANVQRVEWSIAGVFRNGPGRVSDAARQLRQTLGL